MISDKLVSLDDLLIKLESLREQGKMIVFSNGCFDLIHSGHVQYLEKARAEGDILVLGVNSDASVKRLKGESRPLINLAQRMIVLAALESVSYVVSFDEDTPYELIKQIQPDLLIKGGDWQPEQIVGSDIVLGKGGKVLSIWFEEGISTSEIVRKIQTQNTRI